jgi:hypothetical protein
MTTTQVESLDKLHNTGRAGTVDAAVLAHIKEAGPLCRSAVCAAANLRESTACGAIDRLMKQGLVQESEHRVLWVPTNRNVKAYEAVPCA